MKRIWWWNIGRERRLWRLEIKWWHLFLLWDITLPRIIIKVIKPVYLDLIKIYRRDDQTVRPFIFWPVRYCGGKKFVKRFGYKLEFLVTTNIDLKYPQIFTSDHQGSLDVPVTAIGYGISFIGSRLVNSLNNINPSM